VHVVRVVPGTFFIHVCSTTVSQISEDAVVLAHKDVARSASVPGAQWISICRLCLGGTQESIGVVSR
jgi:hypothetical protein